MTLRQQSEPDDERVYCHRCEMWVPRWREPHQGLVPTGETDALGKPVLTAGPLHHAEAAR